jgi:hypothetical protein
VKRICLTALSLLLAGCVLSAEPLLPEMTLRWAPGKAVRAWPVLASGSIPITPREPDPKPRAA